MLPRGSGLGTSSILGGCVIACIAHSIGYEVVSDGTTTTCADNHSKEPNNNIHKIILTHAVLVLEQLMTTGGGWQDQIGGLIGGLKLARSKPHVVFPLQIQVEQIHIPPKLYNELQNRLVLVYTGKPRLAKNILQNVLRSWARRTNDIVNTVQHLVEGAEQVKQAVANENVDRIGTLMTRYWDLKKTMAMAGTNGNAEPECVASLLSFLLERGDIVGGTLCGAGGGGFLILLARKGIKGMDLKQIIQQESSSLKHDLQQYSWHECSICDKGLDIKILDKTPGADDFDIGWHS